jgi:hypothetical protein
MDPSSCNEASDAERSTTKKNPTDRTLTEQNSSVEEYGKVAIYLFFI